jgi:Fic family protein
VSSFVLKPLPPAIDLEIKSILKKSATAHRYLAELKGVSETIPNQGILINALALQEAKDSSAIENIITTHDEIFQQELFPEYASTTAAKEVRDYAQALKTGFELIKKTGYLATNQIVEIQEILEKNNAGLRKLPGSELKNQHTGEIIYTPPQNQSEIVSLLSNLETFVNDDQFYDADILVKMAIMHYQFESIHPFYDGNGRTGRILNVLYLTLKNLLNIPVLYLSRYIVETKPEYYRLLQQVRTSGAWEEWILYILDGIEKTAQKTIKIVHQIREALMEYKHHIRNNHPAIYSQDLINNLFSHPYTKIEFIEHDLNVSRPTASKYLELLVEDGLLKKEKIKTSNYYINVKLYSIFTNTGIMS